MSGIPPDQAGLHFGVFELDLNAGEVRKGGTLIKLQQQPFILLTLLASRAGRLVTREEIQRQIWGDDIFLDFEHALNFCICQIRQALSDDYRKPRYLETLPRKGYRFIMPVVELGGISAGRSLEQTLSHQLHFHRKLSLGLSPFRSLGSEPGQQNFADGISEQLITHLAEFTDVRLISNDPAADHKAKLEFGSDLHANLLLMGSVAWGKERVRITARLLHERTHRYLWTDSFERDLRDPLSLQNEVARAIATAVRHRFGLREETSFPMVQSPKFAAFEDYLKGRFFWSKRTAAGLKKSIDYYEQAIEKDPAFALGHAGLSDSYNMLGHYVGPPREAYPIAKAEALKALELDDTLTEAHTSLAFVTFFHDWDWLAAERQFKRAIQLNPRHANAHHWYALYLAAMERTDEALEEINRARELDPLSLIVEETVGWILYFAGQYDRAIEQYLKTLELDPSFFPAHEGLALALEQKKMFGEAVNAFDKAIAYSDGGTQLIAGRAHVYAVSGKKEVARRMVTHLKTLSKRRYVSPYEIGLVHAGLGETDRAFDWLEKAYLDRSTGLIWLKVEPRVNILRSDSRFKELLRRIGLAA